MGYGGGLFAGVMLFCCGASWASGEPPPHNAEGYRLVNSGLHSVRKTGFLLFPTASSALPRVSSVEVVSPPLNAHAEPLLPVRLLRPRDRSTFIDLFGWEDDDRVTLATYRSTGPVYIKGRAGYLHFDGEPDYLSDLSVSDFVGNFSTSGAFGLGAGYKLSNGERLEFEYTVNRLDQQVFSVGYTF